MRPPSPSGVAGVDDQVEQGGLELGGIDAHHGLPPATGRQLELDGLARRRGGSAARSRRIRALMSDSAGRRAWRREKASS
jgi:hypothetical protein